MFPIKLNGIAIPALLILCGTVAVAQHVTLVERAELSGGRPVAIPVLDEAMPMAIADLSKASDLIVEGRLVHLRSYISDDKAIAYTDYQIVPTRVVHSRVVDVSQTAGPRPPLVLTLLGGTIRVAGTEVTVTDARRKPLNLAGHFLIFATKAPGDNRFSATGGSAGIFEVNGGQRVEPLYRRIDPDPEVHGIPFEEIVQRIQAAAHRK